MSEVGFFPSYSERIRENPILGALGVTMPPLAMAYHFLTQPKIEPKPTLFNSQIGSI